MRYFLVSYITKNKDNSISYGDQSFSTTSGFFSKNEISRNISKSNNVEKDNIIIQNIFEFKNEEDFNNFREE